MARDKLIQRKIYDLLSNRPLMAFVTVFLFVLCVFQIYGIYVLSSGGMVASLCERAGCSARRGGVEEWGGEPVDVVYTWVNGSDPTWLQELRALAGGRDDIDPSRYDDKQELKYSLRSLELYAPWVRHVYVVTAGQLPWWLDASAPRLTLVAHSDIMPAQFLPTFSSPAIESFIHKIPGLSERFLYFNDDIFLGSPLYPSDLYTPSDGYELYTAWNVPECAVGCPWSFLGDKSCDSACNVAACEHDGGDCQGPPQRHYGLGNPPLMPDDYDSPFFDEEERLDADASVGHYPGFDEPPFDSKIVHARQHEDQDLLDSLRPEPGFDSHETRLVKRETEDEFWTPVDSTGDMVHYKNTMRSLKSFRESENSSEEEIKHISDLKLNSSDLTLDIRDLKLNSSELKFKSLLKKPDINDLNISNDAIKYTNTLRDGTTDYVPDISDLKINISHLELVGSLKEQHTNDSNLGSDADKSYLDIEGFRTVVDDETMDVIQGMKDEFEAPLDHPTGGMAIHKITMRSLKDFRESQSRSKEDIEKLNINDLKLNISSLKLNNALKRPNANDLNLRNVVLKNNLVIRDIRTLGDGTIDEIPNVNSRLDLEAEPKLLLDKNNLDIRTLGDDNAKIPDVSYLKLTGEKENYSELGKEESKNVFKKATESLTEKNHLDIIIFRNGKPGEIRDLKLGNVKKDNKFQLGREVPKNLYQSSENLMEKLKRSASMDKSNVSKAVNHFNKSYLKADKKSRQKKSTYEELADDSEPGDERKLAMYARSLIYTNKLLNKEFGFQNRKVPAHVPFLLERSVLEALHARWPTQVADTARNRFRRPNDLQFAFAYYYFLMNERRQLTIQQIFDKYDTDKSGTWSDREVRTVLARVRGLPLTAEAVRALEAAARSCDSETNRAHPTPPAERYLDSDMPTLSKDLVCGCAALAGPLRSSLGLLPPRARPRPAAPRHTFAMLDSNLTKAVAALDEIRRDTKKFICINDNLDPAREEENVIVRMLLQELYEALLPLPSSFELPPGVANRFLRLEELEAWRAGRRAAWLGLALCAALLTALSLYHLRSFRRSLHRVNALL